MRLTGTLFISLLYLTLTACSGGAPVDLGVARLSESQKTQAEVALVKLDNLEQTIGVLDGTKEVEADIEELVSLILNNCSIEETNTGDEKNGTARKLAVGAGCPIALVINKTKKTIDINGEEYTEVVTELEYSTEDERVLSLLDIRALEMNFSTPAGGLPSYSFVVDFVNSGLMKLDDTLSFKLLSNSNVELTYKRAMAYRGFSLDARVILELQVVLDENGEEKLEEVEDGSSYYLNNISVSRSEIFRFFPGPFIPGKRMSVVGMSSLSQI